MVERLCSTGLPAERFIANRVIAIELPANVCC